MLNEAMISAPRFDRRTSTMQLNNTTTPESQSNFASATAQQNGTSSNINELPDATSTTMLSARIAAMATGVGILAAATWGVIDAGQLAGSSAALPIALAAGVAVGASVLPRIGSRALVCGMVLALVAGEMSGLLAVAERVVVNRDIAASKQSGANGTTAGILDRIKVKEAELTAHRATAALTVATKGCAVECRGLLEGQGAAIVAEIAVARVELKTAPVARSATPLADRLGLQAWALDLLAAVLLSVGANGLAAVLIAWASHAGLPRDPVASMPDPITAVSTPANPEQSRKEYGDAHDPIMPSNGGVSVPLSPVAAMAVSARTRGVLKLIQQSGGTLNGSQRAMAEQLGLSQPVLSRVLGEAKAAGLVSVASDRMTGTRVMMLA
jgi:hypothetical protein